MDNKKVLIIKTSSLGDILHTLPALTDCSIQHPNTIFDWVVEKSFSEIPTWHPKVNKVIPVSIRKWRKQPIQTLFSGPWKAFRQDLKSEQYDAIIDAQGLIKSAFLAPMASGHRYGLDRNSARESLASLFYQTKIHIKRNQHAVERTRQLFAKALDYKIPTAPADYGIKSSLLDSDQQPYLVFLHGTTWQSKHYPEEYWHQLIKLAATDGLKIKLLWGNEQEQKRAKRLAANYSHVEIMPKLNLSEIAILLASATASIAVDTGLGHLAAAVDCPTLSLFSSTNPELTGAYGKNQKHLPATLSCSPCMQRNCPVESGKKTIEDQGYNQSINPPCFSTIPPDIVWLNLQVLFSSS